MKISIDKTKDNLELVRLMGSLDRAKAYEAQAAVAKFIAPVIEKVLLQARTLSAVYEDFQFDEDDNPSIPLDLYSDSTAEGMIQIWSQAAAGGLASNFMQPASQELKFQTYSLDSAVSFDAKHARKARLPVINASLTKVAQEFLRKMERTSANQLLGVLAANATAALLESTNTTGKIMPADFNGLLLKMARMTSSWVGGTEVGNGNSVTDLFISPERMFDLRAMAYNPVNVAGANGTAGTAASGAIAAPDAVRAELFNGGGVGSFYGVTLHELKEFGPAQKFTKVFKALADAASVTFNSGDDLMLGIDMTKGGIIRPVQTGASTSTTVSLVPDDQYSARQEKIGMYGKIEEGRIIVDKRVIAGVRVKYP